MEHKEIPFFLDTDRSFVLEIVCLLFADILDSFRAEYLALDLPISAGSVAYLVLWWEAVAVLTVVLG